MTQLLALSGVESAYGDSQVLFGVDLHVDAGEIVTLLGRNGMGKTTTVRAIMGLNPPRRGTVLFQGTPVQGKSPDHIARLGVGLVPEGRQVFPNLTVEENLVAFAARRSGKASPWTLQRAYELFPRLQERRGNMGNQLSGGEQQMVAIARALMTNPQLLIVDEATEGLAPLIRDEIWRCLGRLRQEGQAVLVIDKYVDRLIPISDRHYILEGGKVEWTGTSAQLQANPALWQGYLGV
ncbi:MAG TPA: ABC transporter ATP-binding protein [Ramlibacter sp.]|jgi:branched-chain amino acid transport system ATP-binding protein|nr:ABC transporter ATP-binding protein [Ramlibacter sp.]